MTTFKRARKSILTAVAAAAVVTAGLGTVGAAPAQAVLPGSAITWTSLMYRSLNVAPTAVKLRAALVTEQAVLVTRAGAVTSAKAADASAQAGLTVAVNRNIAAQTARTAADRSLTTAKRNLAKASRKRPRSAAGVTAAKAVVTAATATMTTRQAQAVTAVAALKAAHATANTATAGLNAAVADWTAAGTAIAGTRQAILNLPNAAVLAGQAAAMSKDVVTQVRAQFATADVVQVYGITVHKSVAYAFKRMVDDAAAQGVVLSGSGWRSKERQIELRKINGCPDVWTAPSSSCRVPTAIPGRSLHELAMAVDFTQNGSTLTRQSTGYAWLSAHAAAYGFHNLPAEAWHWSISGN